MTTDRSITVRITNVHGRETMYPVCSTARLLAELAGQKAITPAALAVIERLGYTVRLQRQSLPA